METYETNPDGSISRLKVYSDGTKRWFGDDGCLHRAHKPAVEYPNGGTEWSVYGRRHREDGPAIDLVNGLRCWWVHGKLHRIDGPAVEYSDMHKEWWFNGEPIMIERK
jgi:hypothetical protein